MYMHCIVFFITQKCHTNPSLQYINIISDKQIQVLTVKSINLRTNIFNNQAALGQHVSQLLSYSLTSDMDNHVISTTATVRV